MSTSRQMIINDNGLVIPLPESISKNEYIALELVRSWALGLPKRSCLTMDHILKAYDNTLKHLENSDA